MAALLFEVLYLALKKESFKTVASGLVVLTALAAIVTATTGLIAGSDHRHGDRNPYSKREDGCDED